MNQCVDVTLGDFCPKFLTLSEFCCRLALIANGLNQSSAGISHTVIWIDCFEMPTKDVIMILFGLCHLFPGLLPLWVFKPVAGSVDSNFALGALYGISSCLGLPHLWVEETYYCA